MAKFTDYRENVYRMGIPVRVREIEAELRAYHRDYPEWFLSSTPPQILRPELKNGASSNGTGHVEPDNAPTKTPRAYLTTRQKTLDTLDWIAVKPQGRDVAALRKRGVDMRGMQQLVTNGYLKRTGDVFRRTKKDFALVADRPSQAKGAMTVVKSQTTKKYYGGATLKRREQSAALIASFDLNTPTPAPDKFKRSMGSLVRRGYLAMRGKGLYVRTGKTYVLQPGRDA